MPTATIKVCSFCAKEQDSRTKVHWSNSFGGPVSINFKRVDGIQAEQEWDTCCRACGEVLVAAFYAAVKTLAPAEPNEGGKP